MFGWLSYSFQIFTSTLELCNIDAHHISFFSGHSILRSKMVVEKLGGWQSISSSNGLESRNNLRSRKETQEKTADRLPLFQLKASQFLVLQVLLLRSTISHQRRR